MKLLRLRIEQLPGLSEGLVFEGLCEGLNLVTAPNAFGKSSLIRALGYLLAEPKRDDPPVSLVADFKDGETSWKVTRTGSRIAWQRDGKPAERPALPHSDELVRYWLSMENLVAANADDERLATELMREVRGGFDLGEARLALGKRHGSHEERAFRDARRALDSAEQSAMRLSADQDRLPEIEKDIAEARDAQGLCRQIEIAKQLATTIAERRSLEDKLESFPQRMEALARIDPDLLDKLNTRIETIRAEIHDQERAHLEARAALDQLGLSDDELGPAELALEAALDKLASLQRMRENLAQQEDEAARRTTRERETSNALGGGDPPQLTRDNLQRAEGFAASLLKLNAEQDALTTKIELAGESPSEELIKQHERGVDALRDWLDTEVRPIPVRAITWLLVIAFAAALASLGVTALPPVVGFICVGISLAAIGIACWRLRGTATHHGDVHRQAAEKRFSATNLQVSAWDAQSVRASLTALETALSRLIAQRSLSEGCEKDRARLNTVRHALEEKASEQARLAESIGFDPAMPLTELDRFIRLAKDWDDASLLLAQLLAAIERSRAAMQATVNEIVHLLRPWHVEVSTDPDGLAAHIKAFQQRLKSARSAAQELDQANQALSRLAAEAEEREAERASLYERVGVLNGDEEELSRRLSLREAWAQTRKDLDAARVRETQHLKALAGAPQLIEQANAAETSRLVTLLEERTSKAKTLEPLIDERAQIVTRIEQAEAGSSVQSALAVLSESLSDLERKRDELLRSEATDLLLDEVETAYTTEHQPQLLGEADRLFRQVTAHEFALALSEQGRFEAVDMRQDVRRDLDELSTGTRMQLLLSVRMAWVRHRAPGALNLPIILDEALTTSDEQRFMELARTLNELASSTDTQFVYLSARRGEVGLWKAAIGEAPNCIDLETERDGARSKRASDTSHFEVVPRREVPKPAGGAQAYAKALGVPGIDPHKDAGEIHVFHLLRDDLDQVHRLMALHRIHSLGQVESLLAQSAASLDDSDWQARLTTRCRAAHAWVSAWRQGRGRKLEAAGLEASGIVSDTFLPRVCDLLAAPEVDGDAQRLLNALNRGEVKRFHARTLETLKDWLRSHGYVDERPKLSSQERHQEVLRATGTEEDAVLRDMGRCVEWLEAGASPSTGSG